jgi:hypothetical protein
MAGWAVRGLIRVPWYGESSPHFVAMLRVVDPLLERAVRLLLLFVKHWRSS